MQAARITTLHKSISYLFIKIPHSYSLVAAAGRQSLAIVVILHICEVCAGQEGGMRAAMRHKMPSNVMFGSIDSPCTKSE
jgi:hypothetical protein